VESLRAERCEALLDRLHAIDERLREERETVSALLHQAVSAQPEGGERRHLVQLRRDLFNLRAPRPAGLAAAHAALAGEGATAVEAFAALLHERGEAAGALRDAYAAETEAARRRFRALLADPAFQNGLLLSSRALYDAQARYLEAEGVPGGKLAKTERGLLRYFTRTAMKATPFATLCAVVPGSFGGEADRVEVLGDPLAKRSMVRLNKQIFGIVTRFLTGDPLIRPHLHVELNPTIGHEEGQRVYLAVHRGREVFQRLPGNAAVDLVAETVAARGHLALHELTRALADHPEVEATEEEARLYTDRLVEAGLLRFRLGIREQEVDWDLPLRALLEAIPDERAAALAAMLAALRAQVERFEGAGVKERVAILVQAREAVEAGIGPLKLRGANTAVLLPFMEDATAEAAASLGLTRGVRRAVASLERYVRLTRRLASVRAEQATMRHFFDGHYAPGGGAVPLLRFYEDYHREHLKEHLALARRAERGDYEAVQGYSLGNPFRLEWVERLRAAERGIAEAVARAWLRDPAAEQIDLSAGELARIVDEVPGVEGEAASVTAFVEYVPPGDGRPGRLILSHAGYNAGYGKYFSRFLSLFPGRVQNDLLEAGRTLGEGLTAEICGDGNHNANLHPPLLPWEISYPTGESGVAEEQLPTTELVVERHPANPAALRIVHEPTGQPVVPVDLGFVTPSARPPLFQLLSRFSPAAHFNLRLPDYPLHLPAALRDAPRAQGDDAPRLTAEEARAAARAYQTTVTHQPRVVFDGALVLRRRRWVVPAALLPRREAAETAAAFFERANRWRREHGLPRETYVQMEAVYGIPTPPEPPEPGAEGAPPAAGPPARRFDRAMLNDLKPQFIDFASPLLVELFGHMAPSAGSSAAIFVERDPGPDALVTVGGERFAAEQVIQLGLGAADAG
jgi:hypothetical protein